MKYYSPDPIKPIPNFETQLFNKCDLATLFFDLELLCISDANPAFQKLSQQNIRAFLGQSIYSFFDLEYHKEIHSALDLLRSTGTPQVIEMMFLGSQRLHSNMKIIIKIIKFF